MKLELRKVLLVMLLGVAVYGALVVHAGLDAVSETLTTFNWYALLLALLLSSANYGIRFLKWEYYLAKLRIVGIPKPDSLLVFLSGFVLTVTPGKLGEVFKSAVLARTHAVATERTAPIVVAERLTDVIGIVVLIVVGSTAFTGGLLWALLGVIAVLSALLFVFWEAPLYWLLGVLRRTPLSRFVPKLETAYLQLQVLLRPKALWFPSLLSLIGWGGEGYGLCLLLEGFGQDTSVLLSVFVYATATLAGAVVPVPGGLGVAEALIQEQLVHMGGVEAAASTAAMLLLRFATLWWGVAVGFAALGLLRIRFGAGFLKSPSAPASDNSTPG